MNDNTRKVSTIIIVIMISYFALGLMGVLPDQIDIIKKTTGTELWDIVEYNITTENSNPLDMVYNANDGKVYFLEDPPMNVHNVCNIDQSGNIEEYPLDDDYYFFGITYNSHDKCIYYNGINTNYSMYESVIVKRSPSGVETSYVCPVETHITSITFDSNNNCIYFTAMTGMETGIIGKMTEGGTYTTYNITLDRVYPFGITFNTHDNYIYYIESAENKVGKMTEDGDFTYYDIPTPSSTGVCMVFNPHDNCLYLSENNANHIAKMTETGDFTEYDIKTDYWPSSICYNSYDNCIYFSSNWYNSIGRITETGTFTEYELPYFEDGYTDGITYNPEDFCVYFSEPAANKIGKIYTYIPPETPEIPETQNKEIRITITQIGQWVKGIGGFIGATVNQNITVIVKVYCADGIDDVKIIYTPISSTSSGINEEIDMDEISGDDKYGTWQAQIPAQSKTGKILMYVYAKSEKGVELSTDSTYVEIVASIPPTTTEPTPIETRTVLYMISIGFLSIMAIAINYTPDKWHRRF